MNTKTMYELWLLRREQNQETCPDEYLDGEEYDSQTL